jgi:hypothetical protein
LRESAIDKVGNTNGDKVVRVHGLEEGGHILHPGLDQLLALWTRAARLIDQIPRQDGGIIAIPLQPCKIIVIFLLKGF